MSAVSDPSALPAVVPVRAGAGRVAPLARGAVAIALGLVITFSIDHSAAFGNAAFSVFAVATAVALGVGAIIDRRAGRSTWLSVTLAALAFVAAMSALALGTDYFVVIVSAWALLSGATELTAGFQAWRARRPARDEVLLGVISLALAIALLIVPPDYTEPWQVVGSGGEVEAAGSVTADIMTVGVLGAWAVVHGLMVIISALTPGRGEVRA